MNESSIKPEDFAATDPNPWRPWLVASIAALAILGVSIGLMAWLGLFRTPLDDTGARSLRPALGLVGAVLSAVVALVGTIIKYSIDDRNARQASLEASRNYSLALQAEQRNRIEAAIRAVGLLSENNQDATMTQMGGALLALVSLGEFGLAVSLLGQLWPDDKTTTPIASIVLTAALRSESEETHDAAAVVLLQNAARIEQTGYNIWPIENLGWRTNLNDNCRLGLVLAAASWLKSVAEERLSPQAAVVLFKALDDPNSRVTDIAASCLRSVVKAFPKVLWTDYGVTVEQIELLSQYGEASPTGSGQRYQSQLADLFSSIRDKSLPTDSSKASQTIVTSQIDIQ